MTIKRVRDASDVEMHLPTQELIVGSDPIPLRVVVTDSEEQPVADGTVVEFSTDLGSIPASATTEDGIVQVLYAPGNQSGEAKVTATVASKAALLGRVTSSLTVNLIDQQPNQIRLAAGKTTLAPDGVDSTQLIATVLDYQGNPVANWPVRIGVEGGGDDQHDPALGTVADAGVIEAVTNQNGEVIVTYQAGTEAAEIRVRAELLVEEGGVKRAVKAVTADLISVSYTHLTLPTIPLV